MRSGHILGTHGIFTIAGGPQNIITFLTACRFCMPHPTVTFGLWTRGLLIFKLALQSQGHVKINIAQLAPIGLTSGSPLSPPMPPRSCCLSSDGGNSLASDGSPKANTSMFDDTVCTEIADTKACFYNNTAFPPTLLVRPPCVHQCP